MLRTLLSFFLDEGSLRFRGRDGVKEMRVLEVTEKFYKVGYFVYRFFSCGSPCNGEYHQTSWIAKDDPRIVDTSLRAA